MKKIEIGLDLTKPVGNIKRYKEFINEKLINNISEINDIEIGLDLTNDISGYKLDLTKYGKDIE
jgi:hypothetical protein